MITNKTKRSRRVLNHNKSGIPSILVICCLLLAIPVGASIGISGGVLISNYYISAMPQPDNEADDPSAQAVYPAGSTSGSAAANSSETGTEPASEPADVSPSLSDTSPSDKPADETTTSESTVKTPETKNQFKGKVTQNIPKGSLPSSFKGFSSETLVNRKPVADFKRGYSLSFTGPEKYSSLEGITCFRGNNYRDSASYGRANVKAGKLQKIWYAKNGYIDEWTGTGWNGQPAIVKWSDDIKSIMNIYPDKKSKDDLKEVIYATLDGNIYFLDLDDGKPTRPPINVGSPHKGSVMVDPRGYPLLYAGQGIPTVGGKPVPIGYRIFNLINQKQLYFINGMDPDTYRYWGAFDSGALVDSATDTFIECGENGIIYSGKLHTVFQPGKKSISIKPDLVKYRYKSPFGTKIGVENSPAIYKNYIYFADNSGLFQCVDLNTLKPVWIRNVNDDTDSSTAIEESENGVYLYTACEVDHQGDGGSSHIRKLDALTGKLIWERVMPARYDSHTNGGALASPVIGREDIGNIVIYNIAMTGIKGNESTLTALDKKSGKPVWTVQMKHYCWSSPVAVYSEEGKSYIIACDSVGNMFLYEGKTGKLLDTLQLGSNIEASPAVYDNMVVVGTRGCRIWGVKLT